VALTAAVGPVKARFKGRMQLADIDAPRSYTIQFEGQGGAAGFGKGDARVTLEAAGDDATTLSYTARAQVGGKLAQIGSRLVDGAARKIAAEFFKRFGEQFGGDAEQTASNENDSTATDPPAASADDTAATGDEPQKRKRSWTAWISKS
ncbi:MAG: carbon monoxide dehydrogenase subunit G, partial [Paraburkholderia tropica]